MAVLAHRRVGHGPRPLLLLHGFLGEGRNLLSLARRVVTRAPALSTVALDLTGHGSSPPLPATADLGTLAADVLETARALSLPVPLALAGHSLGGRVALRAGLDAPAALSHIVLLDITPSPVAGQETARVLEALRAAPESGASRDAFRAALRAGGLERRIVEWLLQSLRHDATGYRWRVDRAALADLHRRTSAEDLWPAVERPRPYAVACLRGARSGYVPLADVRRLQAAGCPVDTVEGAGHFLHVDRPVDLVERLVARLG